MPTSSELVARKRQQEEWDAFMAGLRASAAAQPAPQAPTPAPEQPVPEMTADEQASAAGRLLRSRRNG